MLHVRRDLFFIAGVGTVRERVRWILKVEKPKNSITPPKQINAIFFLVIFQHFFNLFSWISVVSAHSFSAHENVHKNKQMETQVIHCVVW